MPSQSDAAAGGDAGARRRRVLAAHAELFNEALTDEAERLPKLANVVEALALASDAQPLEPLTPEADHAVGAVRLERVRRRIAVWWASDDPAALAEAALERQVDILIVVQGFPLEMAVDAEWADKLALLDGRDLTLLLEGRWTLGQAVRFKHGEQAAHGRFISLRVAPPADLPDEPDSEFRPEDGEVLPSNVDDMPSPHDPDDAGRVDNPDIWDVGLGGRREPEPEQSTLRSNIESHEQTFAETEAFEQAEARRLRRFRIGFMLAGLLAVLFAVATIRGRQDAEAASLDQAADTAVRAARLEFEAYQSLDSSALRSVYDESLAQEIEARVQQLRANGVYLESDISIQVIDARIEGESAGVLVRESGNLATRRRADGETLQRGPLSQDVGFFLARTADQRWRVVQRAPVG
ncbi:MAG: hypothetical protein OXP73_11440 [Chloroflexota bacterium]|nr:hypothetical protein [Chloroflexota bacterium]